MSDDWKTEDCKHCMESEEWLLKRESEVTEELTEPGSFMSVEYIQ